MDAEDLLGSLVRGALTSRRKRSRGALRALTSVGGPLLNPTTLLTAAGLAWGAFEAATRKPEATGFGGAPTPAGGPYPPIPGGVPPLPTGAGAPPPLPTAAGADVPEAVARLLRLTISAARADGTLSDEERAQILAHAREKGAEAIVQRELDNPRPLAEIVPGVQDPQLKQDLYVLAFTIVRADESVSGAERIYLAQLAHLLGLDAATATRLESETAARIDQAAS
jgi:hypothetical protein